MHQARI